MVARRDDGEGRHDVMGGEREQEQETRVYTVVALVAAGNGAEDRK